jgi:flagellar basal body-associated protein FliL
MQIIIAVIGLTAMALLTYYFWILMKGDEQQ